MNKNVLIIGYGVVGHNLHEEIKVLQPDIVDKYKKDVTTKRDIKYDIAFICVDTPLTGCNELDTTEVKNAISENEALLYVIKSTVPVGTTDELILSTGKNIVFSPEYYGGTQHCNNFDFSYTIVGGDKKECRKLIQLLQYVYDGRHQFRITDTRTAELVKFMENSYLATKVSFCNQFYEIAKRCGVAYEELRELFVLDPRVNPSHTFVYKETPYWSSHCLNKDVPAIANQGKATFLEAVIKFNKEQKTTQKTF